MISETYFLEQCLHNNFIVGGCVRVNQNNGRYAWHRVTEVLQSQVAGRLFIFTVELKADWTDGDHHAWPDKTLVDRMNLTSVIARNGCGFIARATHWEHDVLEPFVEQYHVHLN